MPTNSTLLYKYQRRDFIPYSGLGYYNDRVKIIEEGITNYQADIFFAEYVRKQIKLRKIGLASFNIVITALYFYPILKCIDALFE